jgi:hypothetical protein
MKISKPLMVLLVSGAVGGTVGVADHTPEHTRQQTQYGDAQTVDVAQKLTPIDKDAMDNELTANKVIGKEVYGSDGKNLGKVHDLKLAGTQYSKLQLHFMQGKDAGDRAADRVDRATERAADSLERTGDRTADALDSDRTDRTSDPAADRVDRATDRAADNWERAGDRAADSLERAGDRAVGTTSPGMVQDDAQVLAIIQAGGILGVGADYFAVPLDLLQYDAEEERFQLAITEAQLEQIRDRTDGDQAAVR